MTTECQVLIGVFKGFSWIRCEGKGSFLNSPLLKQFGDARIAEGERCLVVDLEACTGMDSTFMGTLAGLASRLTALDGGGSLQIADAGARNRRSLEDLGLDFLLEIDPPSPPWADTFSIRSSLKPAQALSSPGAIQRAEHVLEAHQVLSETNEKNARVFANVVTLLQEDLAEKSQQANGPSPS